VQEIAPFPSVRGQEKVASLSPDQKRALVQRVVKSQAFSRSPAMRAFLLYVTDHAILGRTDMLKEQTIGTEVLGRRPNYDPADDNIVRVRAHELRERLGKYFALEGAEEQVVVTIPRGAYAPEFLAREAAAGELPPAAPQLSEPAPASKAATRLSWRQWLMFVVVLVVAVSASIVLTRSVLRSGIRSSAPRPNDAVHDFWGQFFDKPNEELKVVYADSSFALWQRLSGKTLNLGDYLSHKYLDVQNDKFLELAEQRTTSPADTTISVHLENLALEFGGQVGLQFSRDANAEFFYHGNIVLIGSRRSNPWVEVYEPNLNFELDQDPGSGSPLFRNRSPQSNEAKVYALPAMQDSKRTEQEQFIQKAEEKEFTSYGLIALLKGCGNRGFTVVVEGLNMQATQAVGDLITDPQRLDTMLKSIGHTPGTNVAPFEALVQITSLPGGYDNPKVVAFRLRPADACVGN
jgi:hypothetical protein